jgi:hypothetical protein
MITSRENHAPGNLFLPFGFDSSRRPLIKPFRSLPKSDASERNGFTCTGCYRVAVVVGMFDRDELGRYVIQEPVRSDNAPRGIRVGVLRLSDSLERILERIEEIVQPDHFDVGATEAPQTADVSKFPVGKLNRAIYQQMPMHPAVGLEFHFPTPPGFVRPEAAIPSITHESPHPIFSGEVSGDRVPVEKFRVQGEGDEPPPFEAWKAAPLDLLPLASNARVGIPIRGTVSPDVQDPRAERGGGLSAMSFRIMSRGASSAQPHAAQTWRRRGVENVSLRILTGCVLVSDTNRHGATHTAIACNFFTIPAPIRLCAVHPLRKKPAARRDRPQNCGRCDTKSESRLKGRAKKFPAAI